ncbi:uncharacterized protein LOC131025590 [Salvia miltiorrhiza]|uniref:uncharacterized protein LOC131025590 n=1 Tax=Salvia miltiorrhiza TaxID=226208 RepID=UPI0025ABAAA2|nr:uncharacterized protein LOC131025590 [Salvia miltiorrhiza]
MGVMYTAGPFDKWGIDIVGKLPTTPGGKCFLIVAVDYFSKWVEAEAVGKIDEVTVERFIWRNICCRFGVPRIIVSDNGTQFTGQRIADFCDRMDITQRFVSVAHPQANGQVELANRSICEGIKKRLNQIRGKWVEELDTVLWAYRTSPNTATREASFTLVYGSNAVIPAEARLESYRITTYDTEHNSELQRTELDLVEEQREEAQIIAAKYKSIIKAGYDKRVIARKLAKGDLVLKRADALKPVGKFEPNWEGPFIITEVLGSGAYTLSDPDDRALPRPWNINTLKKFYVVFQLAAKGSSKGKQQRKQRRDGPEGIREILKQESEKSSNRSQRNPPKEESAKSQKERPEECSGQSQRDEPKTFPAEESEESLKGIIQKHQAESTVGEATQRKSQSKESKILQQRTKISSYFTKTYITAQGPGM